MLYRFLLGVALLTGTLWVQAASKVLVWEEVTDDRSFLDEASILGPVDRSKRLQEILPEFQSVISLVDETDQHETRLRRLIDNQDQSATYTLVDTIDVDKDFKLWSTNVSPWGPAGPAFGFKVGAGVGATLIDIRPLKPSEVSSLNPLYPADEISSRATGEKKIRLDFGDGIVGDVIDKVKDEWEKIWRKAKLPFRIPFSSKDIDELQDGEVISFAGQGQVELGASVGWKLDPTGIVDGISASVGLTTFVKGEFRISVMREAKKLVQVSLKRLFGGGASGTVGGSIGIAPFEGIMIIEKVGPDFQIIPFKLNVQHAIAKSFDVTYRYDLSNPHGREAYERAALGLMALSDELAVNADGSAKNFDLTGVEKIETRQTDEDHDSQSRLLKLDFIFKQSSVTKMSFVETKITDPNGVRHEFKSLVENSREWKTVWKEFERLSYRFAIDLDPVTMDATVVAQASIEDSATRGPELLSYELETENVLNLYGYFTRPPDPKRMRVARAFSEPPIDVKPLPLRGLGRSRFNYELEFDPEMVERFLQVPESERWALLENAFGVPKGRWSSPLQRSLWKLKNGLATLLNIPLYLTDFHIREGDDLTYAEDVLKHWNRASDTTSARDRTLELARVFYQRFYNYELIRLVRGVLDREVVPFYLDAYNPLFGKKKEAGNAELAAEDLASRRQEAVDGSTARTTSPKKLELVRIKTGVWRLSFTLDEVPETLYFALDQWLWEFFKLKKPVARVAVYPSSMWQPGMQEFVIDRKDKNNPWYPLIKDMHGGRKYHIEAAAYDVGKKWSKVTQAEAKF